MTDEEYKEEFVSVLAMLSMKVTPAEMQRVIHLLYDAENRDTQGRLKLEAENAEARKVIEEFKDVFVIGDVTGYFNEMARAFLEKYK